MKLTSRELATVLAALRYWQRVGTLDHGHPEDEIATDNGRHDPPLNVDEIDKLCMRLNLNIRESVESKEWFADLKYAHDRLELALKDDDNDPVRDAAQDTLSSLRAAFPHIRELLKRRS